ncbi:hypothetical protein IQ07DRAFT_643849 [Pyrenochaeta sp. DS3sAY3a]|nr:hypothetical protein IQ07DRAFT_643849 [Pyrenochaeta sp. DS3sAY3a]
MVFGEDTFGNLFRFGGGWGNISGPGLFMTKTIVTGGITAVAYGFAGSTLAAAVYGTAALPFVISASAGFILGSVAFYKDSVSRALLCVDRYPRLLRLHLQSNFPRQRFDLWDEPQFTSARFRRDWVLSSMLVASWMSAAPALERITELQEEDIVAAEVAKGSRQDKSTAD